MKLGAAYDGGYFTPGEVLDEMRTIDTAVNNLSLDVAKAAVSDDFKLQFLEFRKEWKAFYDDNKNVISRSMNQTFAKTLEYRDRFDEWRKLFIVEGGQVSAPGLPTFNKARGDKSFPWKTLFVGAGLVAAGYWYIGRNRHD